MAESDDGPWWFAVAALNTSHERPDVNLPSEMTSRLAAFGICLVLVAWSMTAATEL